MMLRAVIIDDEPHCIRSLLADLEKHCPSVSVIETCNSAKEGILSIKKHSPDLLFLDVQMPWMNGFEMLEVMGDIKSAIIFTTAHDEFAAKAFRISAVDYLLKPINSADLVEAIAKVEKMQAGGPQQNNIDNLLKNFRNPFKEQKIALPQREGFEFVNVSDISYCEAEGAYTKIWLEEAKKTILVSKSLGDVEELLPTELFQRIHHSTVVNLEQIAHFLRTDGGFVVLKNGKKLSVSKARKESLLARLGLA